jgi:hypothetical protein
MVLLNVMAPLAAIVLGIAIIAVAFDRKKKAGKQEDDNASPKS